MSNNKQIVILHNIRKNRADKMAAEYRKALDEVKVAEMEIEKIIESRMLLKEQLKNVKISFSKVLMNSVIDHITLTSWRVSIGILEREISDSVVLESECRSKVDGLKVLADEKKIEYRKVMVACEKIELMQSLI